MELNSGSKSVFNNENEYMDRVSLFYVCHIRPITHMCLVFLLILFYIKEKERILH